MKNRLWNRLKAFFGGYFWLPCPICKRNFGGHEWLDGNGIDATPHSGVGVCPECGPEAKRRNAINWERWQKEPQWWTTYVKP